MALKPCRPGLSRDHEKYGNNRCRLATTAAKAKTAKPAAKPAKPAAKTVKPAAKTAKTGAKECPPCPSSKVCNAESGRCVLRTGVVGKRVLAGSQPSKPVSKSTKYIGLSLAKIKTLKLTTSYDGSDLDIVSQRAPTHDDLAMPLTNHLAKTLIEKWWSAAPGTKIVVGWVSSSVLPDVLEAVNDETLTKTQCANKVVNSTKGKIMLAEVTRPTEDPEDPEDHFVSVLSDTVSRADGHGSVRFLDVGANDKWVPVWDIDSEFADPSELSTFAVWPGTELSKKSTKSPAKSGVSGVVNASRRVHPVTGVVQTIPKTGHGSGRGAPAGHAKNYQGKMAVGLSGVHYVSRPVSTAKGMSWRWIKATKAQLAAAGL